MVQPKIKLCFSFVPVHAKYQNMVNVFSILRLEQLQHQSLIQPRMKFVTCYRMYTISRCFKTCGNQLNATYLLSQVVSTLE